MGKLKVKSDTLSTLGVGAGLILTSAPTVNETTHAITITDSSILGATRGGISFDPKPQVRSRSIDGLAPNTVGIHANDRFEPTLSATFVTHSLAVLLKACGFADTASSVLTARHEVKSTDYVDMWFIEQQSGGGALIYALKKCICTAGANVKTNENGEVEIPLTFIANYTVSDQDTVPFTITEVPAPTTGA